MRLGLVGVSLLLSVNAFSAFDTREATCNSLAIGAISVSTNSATQLSAGSSNLPGRTSIELIDTDSTWNVAIGTFSTLTYAAGFVITASTQIAATSRIKWPIGGNFTLYGIGQGNSSNATVNVRVKECAQ